MSTTRKASLPLFLSTTLLLLLVCSSVFSEVSGKKSKYLEGNLDSLMLPKDCSSTKKDAPLSGSSMEISHRYGPCSPWGSDESQSALILRLLRHDESRVAAFNSLLQNSTSSALGAIQLSLPARSGGGSYLVTLSLGTPAQTQTVIVDTGSTVNWVQCQPCLVSCHPQAEPIFSPAASSTYRNLSCTTVACSLLSRRGCTTTGVCIYNVLYGDGSTTTGYLAQETLTLAGTDAFPGFVFGCGQNNQGLFGREAGLFGLSRNPLSLYSQTSSRYGSVFSYCLPSFSSGTGDLTLGSVASTVVYTPMLSDSRAPSLYFLNLVSISVGGRVLPVSPTVFSTAGTLIDSGTTVTRLPATAYTALRTAFRAGMSQYRLTTGFSILDTCYDFTGLSTVSVPAVTLTYSGVNVNLGFRNIMIAVSASKVCLAFAGNSNDVSLGIIGSIQQAGLRVVYDVGNSRIGFGSGTCG